MRANVTPIAPAELIYSSTKKARASSAEAQSKLGCAEPSDHRMKLPYGRGGGVSDLRSLGRKLFDAL